MVDEEADMDKQGDNLDGKLELRSGSLRKERSLKGSDCSKGEKQAISRAPNYYL